MHWFPSDTYEDETVRKDHYHPEKKFVNSYHGSRLTWWLYHVNIRVPNPYLILCYSALPADPSSPRNEDSTGLFHFRIDLCIPHNDMAFSVMFSSARFTDLLFAGITK